MSALRQARKNNLLGFQHRSNSKDPYALYPENLSPPPHNASKSPQKKQKKTRPSEKDIGFRGLPWASLTDAMAGASLTGAMCPSCKSLCDLLSCDLR